MQKVYNEQITEIKLFDRFKILSIKKVIKEALEDDITQVTHFVSPDYFKEEFNNNEKR